jgi:hypothetical protein
MSPVQFRVNSRSFVVPRLRPAPFQFFAPCACCDRTVHHSLFFWDGHGYALGRLLGRIKSEKSPMFMRLGTVGRMFYPEGMPRVSPASASRPVRLGPFQLFSFLAFQLLPVTPLRPSRPFKGFKEFQRVNSLYRYGCYGLGRLVGRLKNENRQCLCGLGRRYG